MENELFWPKCQQNVRSFVQTPSIKLRCMSEICSDIFKATTEGQKPLRTKRTGVGESEVGLGVQRSGLGASNSCLSSNRVYL